ncbi:hypothetical protein CLM71_10105 [Serratia sp. MYb239]|uniref:hypothetical protein n=1 Tax=Serratia sp. MYb239 TaxID=2033438 RepID=UPI000CF6946E|nr:hypothetical protein [Serratia sp. MYb239]AVJ17467.1 hypothetical protein CLM71_10105 [Serratia sp. MYb239]
MGAQEWTIKNRPEAALFIYVLFSPEFHRLISRLCLKLWLTPRLFFTAPIVLFKKSFTANKFLIIFEPSLTVYPATTLITSAIKNCVTNEVKLSPVPTKEAVSISLRKKPHTPVNQLNYTEMIEFYSFI